jgi:choline dehydrogenase
VANRLTEVSGSDVLLIEAGGKENFVMDIPMVANLLPFIEANWKYRSVRSSNSCLSMENRQCMCHQGKVMGGTSTINFMIYTRGNKRNYDQWEEMGNTGWGYKDVLPFFLKHENMSIPELARDRKYHSTRGELTISYAPYRSSLADAFISGGKEMGYNIIDYNGETQNGFSYMQSTTRNGSRCSASRAFLHPIKNRKNFHVKKRSTVTKILIDPITKTAFGVEFVHGNRKYEVRARKEIILSAGAINSPQLLILSGIGPRKHLRDLNIPVIQDLKVGYNLMDHPAILSIPFILNQSVAYVIDDLANNRSALVDYLSYHQGPFSVPGGGEGIAFLDTRNPRSKDGNPDIEIAFFAAGIPSEITFYKMLGYTDEFYNAVFKQIQGVHTFTLMTVVLQPKSRGRIMLKSANPHDSPLIHLDLFQNPEDLEKQLLAIKETLKLSKTSAFQKFGPKIHDIPVPGCKFLQFGTDDYWRCAARHMAVGIWHYSGTCKMGPYWDPDAVVDPRLRVYGVKGLRVIDASITPLIPDAHTNGPCMMIGEKGADLVKEDWGYGTLLH